MTVLHEDNVIYGCVSDICCSCGIHLFKLFFTEISDSFLNFGLTLFISAVIVQ